MTESPQRQRIGVIGAGMTGLTAAYKLLQSGFDVVLLEATEQPGGMVTSFKLGREQIEYIYHHIFTSDHHVIELASELGLSEHLSWYQSREALFSGNRHYPFSAAGDLLRFGGMSLLSRLRTGLTVLKAGRISNWRALEKKTAAEWLCRHSGRQAFNRLWKPLLKSKFELDAEEISAVWIWNKFKLRGQSRDKTGGNSRLGYMKGGFGTLVNKMADAIEKRGGQIYYGHTAMSITRELTPGSQPRYRIECILADCSSVAFEVDAVIATTSGRQFANMAAGLDLPDDYMKQARGLRYKGDLCLVLRLKKSLSPYYWTTVCDNLPFVVVVEHTNLTGIGRYGGHVVYLSRYLDVSTPLWTQPDSEIFQQFKQGLLGMYPDFNPRDIIDWRLRRTRFAQPVISCDYSESMPAMDTPDAGIKLAGMAQIYPEDRGINYAIRLGDQAAEAIRGFCASKTLP